MGYSISANICYGFTLSELHHQFNIELEEFMERKELPESMWDVDSMIERINHLDVYISEVSHESYDEFDHILCVDLDCYTNQTAKSFGTRYDRMQLPTVQRIDNLSQVLLSALKLLFPLDSVLQANSLKSLGLKPKLILTTRLG